MHASTFGNASYSPSSSAFAFAAGELAAVDSTSCVAVSIRRDTKKCHSFAPLLLPERKSYVQGLISTEGEEDRAEWETELVRGMSVPNEANERTDTERGLIVFLSHLH